ncbi:putative ammonium transporter 1 isoform X3 [Acipenser ruthenus]|uniref:putative ammonium transporter 1 isoform X3 n=1 Tax=Acipenser ruthenus TaxID=7906 RepID=UPI00274150A0|nr:putative ammonium transporter 1 isoform X3 [Acipenser ruthenus]
MEGVDAGAVNDFFLIICGIWVMFFKFGFTFVELGKTSGSNTANIIFKNLADTFITLMAYWLHGYAFAFGEGSGFIGSKYFLTLGSPNLCHFFFNYARCAVATTVALGAVIERTEPIGYLISSYVFAGFVYPIASHWVWDVHGFFNPLQSKLPVQLAALGASMQMMGFIGFIIGARYQITAPGEGQLAALCVLNILLAGASSGLYGLILQRLLKSYYDVDCFINTTIAGMVTVCAGANSYIPGISVMCGATSSFFYFIMEWLVLRNKIDDPLHVISIYLGSGVWGLIFAGFFSAQGTLGGTDKIIGNNLLAVVVLFSWTVAIMHPLFYVMKYVKVLRIPRFMEKQGKCTEGHRVHTQMYKRLVHALLTGVVAVVKNLNNVSIMCIERERKIRERLCICKFKKNGR